MGLSGDGEQMVTCGRNMIEKDWRRNYTQNRISYYTRQKDKLFAFYGPFCNCCGETNRVFLTIDHVNNDGNLERKKYKTTSQLCKKIIDAGFPNTYQILCYNCNNGKRLKGICPHKTLITLLKL